MFAQIVAALLALAACTQPQAAPPAPAVSLGANAAQLVHLEIASTPESRERGLMFRRSLATDAGMLFIFPDEAPRAFWMKNTYIPLDMIFIDAANRVVAVVPNAEPLTLQARGVPQPAKYVLEVNGGFAKTHGIAAGQAVGFHHLPQPSASAQ